MLFAVISSPIFCLRTSLTLDNLVAVANRLGVTVDYLLSDSITAKDDTEYMVRNLSGFTADVRVGKPEEPPGVFRDSKGCCLPGAHSPLWASRWITCSRIPSLPKTIRNT